MEEQFQNDTSHVEYLLVRYATQQLVLSIKTLLDLKSRSFNDQSLNSQLQGAISHVVFGLQRLFSTTISGYFTSNKLQDVSHPNSSPKSQSYPNIQTLFEKGFSWNQKMSSAIIPSPVNSDFVACEPNQISLKKGQTVFLFSSPSLKLQDGWSCGVVDDKFGYFPSKCI